MRAAPVLLLLMTSVDAYTPFAARGASVQRRTSRARAPAMFAPKPIDAQDLEECEALSEGSQPEPTPNAGGAIIIGALTLLFTINQLARSLIFYEVDFKIPPSAEAAFQFMNVDIGFGEAQYGILASIGFAAIFSAVSVAAGSIVERVDTRNLLASTAVLWSGATVWQGMAHSFEEVLASRMLSGIGQAFANPASYTILSRLYPRERLSSVNGIYASGLYFGGGLAALSILIDQSLGWRGLSITVGGVGLAAAAAVLVTLPPCPPETPRLPARSAEAAATDTRAATSGVSPPSSDADEGSSLLHTTTDGRAADGGDEAATRGVGADLVLLLSEPTVRMLLLASSFRFLAGFTIGVWIVPFYRQAFPGALGAEFALLKAAVNGIAGAISATGGGVLADRLCERDIRFQQWIPALGSLVAIPFWVGTISIAPTLEASLACLFLEYLFAECWFGPTVAALQAAAPAGTAGLTTGVFSALTLLGNFAPFAIGLAVNSGNFELPALLTSSVSALYVLSALAFVAAGQTRQDLAKVDAANAVP